MGMDVYGKNPTTEVGRYFRNSVWWWHGLAEFIEDHYPELAEACTYWHTNDGDGLDAVDAAKLADAIEQDYAAGVIDQHEAAFRARREAIPKEACTACESTGKRAGQDGTKAECRGCEGTGQREAIGAWYQFSSENLRDFAAFLRASGGFEIR